MPAKNPDRFLFTANDAYMRDFHLAVPSDELKFRELARRR